jgi:hypothetical protein
MATEESMDFITPLQAYAIELNEVYEAFKQAGFTEGEAWHLLLQHLQDTELPIYTIVDGEDDQEEIEEE